MPDIAQILQSRSASNKAKIDKAALKPAAPPAQPQEIPATKPSGLANLFSSIPMPRFDEPEEKCSDCGVLPAEDYHLSINSVAYIFAKNAHESLKLISDENYKLYLSRVDITMKQMYPLLLPSIEPLLGAVECTRDHIIAEKGGLNEEERQISYEDSLVRHIEELTNKTWDEKDFIDGENLHAKLIQRVVKALYRLIAERKAGQKVLGIIKEDVEMMVVNA